jgi:hypothetical protein
MVAALLGVHTPRKYCGDKHTSLIFCVVTFYELRVDGVLGRPLRLRQVPKLVLLRSCHREPPTEMG